MHLIINTVVSLVFMAPYLFASILLVYKNVTPDVV